MSNVGSVESFAAAAPERFPSLASLRAAHTELLKQYREQSSDPAMLTAIEQFMQRGQATGAILDNEDDRWTAQGLLDYWSSVLYRAGKVDLPDATLMAFDPALAPDLDDELCPYLGLEAFRAENEHLFFGRQRLLDKLLKHLADHRLLVVVGSSGSGKSSVVLGGVLPRLVAGALPGSRDWIYYAPLVPGSDPLAALARRLKPARATADWVPQQVKAFQTDPFHLLKLVAPNDEQGLQPVVLFIDQFEEVFTLCREDGLREALVQNLINFVQAEDRANRLILTMRTDFESQLVRLPGLLELFEESHVRTTALEATELREAIAQPAALVGLKFEEGLIDALLSDVLGEPAALPLLQFTLLKLWDHRERNRVTWEAYRRLGGGRLALAKSADEFYDGLILEEQVTMKRILLRMVRPGEGLEVTSRRMPQSELYRTGEAQDRINRVLDKLVAIRLVRLSEGETLDAAQLEVAHEALIRNWPRLVDWLEDERVTLRQRLRLTAAAEQWKSKNRDSSTLLRGILLQEARAYEDLNELERDFIRTSIRAERRNRNAFVLVVTGVVLSLATTTVLALLQAKQAKQQAAIAEILEASTRSKNLVDTSNASLGLALAIATTNRSQQNADAITLPTATGSLLNGLQTAQEQNIFQDHTDAVRSVAMSPDGKQIVSGSVDKTIRIWDAATGKSIGQPLLGHTNVVSSVTVSPDGKQIVSGSWDNTVRIWNLASGEPIGQPLRGHTENVHAVAVSPDGQRIYSGSWDNTVRIWDAVTGESIGQPLVGHTDDVLALAVGFDGQRIVSGSADKTIRIWDAATGEPIGQPLQGHTDIVWSVAISPDDQRIVSSSANDFKLDAGDNTVRIWDVATGELIVQPLRGHTAGVFSVAMSPDGQRIFSGSWDNTIRMWDGTTGRSIGQPLQGHTGNVNSVLVSPDGQHIVSGSYDSTVRIWDVTTGELSVQFLKEKAIVWSVAVSPDGQRIVSGGIDKTLRIWDVVTGEQIGQPLQGHTNSVHAVAVSSDGQRIFSGSHDKTLRIWDAETGEQIGQPLQGHTDSVLAMTVSLDGQRIFSGSRDNTIRIWDAATGEQIGQPLQGHTDSVFAVAVSPDGQRIFSGSASDSGTDERKKDNTVRVWDATTGKQIGKPLQGHTDGVFAVAVSPDGQRIFSGSRDNTVRIWDAATGKQIGQPLQGHTDSVFVVAVSPDGQHIFSGSRDNTVRIWDAATGEPIGRFLQESTDRINSIAVSPDGQHIVIVGDKVVRVLEGTWPSWMRLACDRLKYHPLLTVPETILKDKESLTIVRDAKAACDARPWLQHSQPVSSDSWRERSMRWLAQLWS